MDTPLEEKICNELIELSPKFFEYFVSKEYLIISDKFMLQPFYELGARISDFLHLTGLNTNLTFNEFFNKCFSGKILPCDFSLSSYTELGHNKQSIKYKMKHLPDIIGIFSKDIRIKEDFKYGHVECELATTEGTFTLCFKKYSSLYRPYSLLHHNLLDLETSVSPELILSKDKGKDYYETIVKGDKDKINKYYLLIKDKLSPELTR